MDLNTGKTHPLTEVNTDKSESYHNWSSNSHWFVYSSKGQDGTISRAYIASIDDKGKITKPFLLPQRNPRKTDMDNLDSFNCPDFTLTKVDFDIRTAREQLNSKERKKCTIR